jgi:hypothetical protein
LLKKSEVIMRTVLFKMRSSKIRMWWHILVVPALRSLRQVDQELEASLGYIASSRPAWAI